MNDLEQRIRNELGEALGEASMCWNPRPSSAEFDSEAASNVLDRTMHWMRSEVLDELTLLRQVEAAARRWREAATTGDVFDRIEYDAAADAFDDALAELDAWREGHGP